LDAAVASANSNPGPDTIVLQSAEYVPATALTITGPTTITGSPTFQGSGARINGTTAEGATPGDLFIIGDATHSPLVTFKALQIFGGSELGSGVIHLTNGTLSLQNDSISNNPGTAVLTDFGTTTNSVNTDLSDQTGNAVTNNGTITLLNNTVTQNGSGGINNLGDLHLINTVVAQNDPSSIGFSDCSGSTATAPTVASLDSDNTCGVSLHASNPGLRVQNQWGGPTPGHVPLSTSPLVNVAAANANCPGVDQRFFLRPVGANCDIGSMERGTSDSQGTQDTTAPTCVVTRTAYPSGQPAQQDVTVSDSGSGVFDGISDITFTAGQGTAAFTTPQFPGSVVVTATKNNAGQAVNDTSWQFTATDSVGNSKLCK
jgi:hypothetical protein